MSNGERLQQDHATEQAPYALSRSAGQLLFVSGHVACDDNDIVIAGGIEEQTRHVLQSIGSVLADKGCGYDDVVKCTVWLSDTRDFQRFNRVYKEFFRNCVPARSTVRADLMLDAKIEMEVIAYIPSSQ